MADLALSGVVAEAEQKLQRRVRGRPFVKGISPCPGGVVQNGVRYQALYVKLRAELDGELSAFDEVMLDRAVRLLLRRPKTDADAVKLTSEARRILERLRAERAKAKPAFMSLRERMIAEAAEAEAVV